MQLTDVVPSIAFARNMKWSFSVLRKNLTSEDLQEMVHIRGSHERVAREWIALVHIRETNASRLVDKDESRILVPSIRIVNSAAAVVFLVDQTGTELLKHTKHRGTSRSTSHPQSERRSIIRNSILGAEVPEKEMSMSNIKPAGVLRHVCSTYTAILLLKTNGMVRRVLALEDVEWGLF